MEGFVVKEKVDGVGVALRNHVAEQEDVVELVVRSVRWKDLRVGDEEGVECGVVNGGICA